MGQGGCPFPLVLRVAILEDDILPLNIAESAKLSLDRPHGK
jgi:hypothetical protein